MPPGDILSNQFPRRYAVISEDTSGNLEDRLALMLEIDPAMKFLGGIAVSHWVDETNVNRVSFTQAVFFEYKEKEKAAPDSSAGKP